jgi:hypothetical protein
VTEARGAGGAADPPVARARGTAWRLARVGIALVLLAWLLSRRSLDLSLLVRIVADPVLAVGTVSVWALAHVAIPGLRWRRLARAVGAEVGAGRACANQMVALFLNTAMPGGMGGDVWKTVATDPGRWKPLLGAMIVERASGLGGLAGVFAVAASAEFGGAIGAIAAIASGAAVLGIAERIARVERVAGLIGRWIPRERQESLRRAGVVALGWSLAHYVLLVAWMVVVAARLAPVAQPVATARASAMALLVAVLPIAPGGLGVGHAALAELLGALGYTHGADVYNLFILPQLALNLLGGPVWAARRGDALR